MRQAPPSLPRIAAIILMVLAITIFGAIIIGIMVGADYRRFLREDVNG